MTDCLEKVFLQRSLGAAQRSRRCRRRGKEKAPFPPQASGDLCFRRDRSWILGQLKRGCFFSAPLYWNFWWSITSSAGRWFFAGFFRGKSPWLAFIVPTLIVMAGFNFLEHYVSMPHLGWLLPFTLAGLLWAMARPGYSLEGMWLPGIFFVLLFSFVHFIRCLNPSITCNTEGVADMARGCSIFVSATSCRRPTAGCRPTTTAATTRSSITARRC